MARLSRTEIFDPSEIVAVHTIERTVRRCYLLGDDHLTQKNFDHRKKWFEDKLKQLASNFGVDLLAFSCFRITSTSSFDQGLTSLLFGMIPRSPGVGGPFARNAKSSEYRVGTHHFGIFRNVRPCNGGGSLGKSL